ncbi:MAG: 2-hydroxychromene-2-carboxylate isomerase [Alphaproteobacteria bacterium]|nr:2-hydroxychromene-2-carboxylate isomerase [Alphaproteobacteria bacterium]
MTQAPRTVDYYYSTRSSFTYLGAARLNALAAEHGFTLNHRPIILSITMPPIGGRPFGERPPMLQNYATLDLMRWADHLGIPVQREPVFHDGPVELPSGIVIAGQRAARRGEEGDVDRLSLLVLKALWGDDRDIADPTVISALCTEAGYGDPDALISEALSDGVQAELARNCREAVIRGVIGAPTYFIANEPFYGQDRLDFVARAMARETQRTAGSAGNA